MAQGGRICFSTSRDEGCSWSKPEILYDGPYDDRDPSIVQLKNGRLICNFFSLSPGDKPRSYISEGSWLTTSDDLGKTWSAPRRVFEDYYCSSPIHELSNGRLIMGLYHADYQNGKKWGKVVWGNGAVALSDDGGDTWTAPIDIPTKVRLDAETDVIQLKDGTLWAAERNSFAPAPMYYSTSTDGGATWSDSGALTFAGQCPCLLRTTQGVILLGYRAFDENKKAYTAIRYSLDECRTWSDRIVVDSTVGAYPSMVNMKNGNVLIAYYEENPGSSSNIRLRTITINSLPETGAK